MIQISSRNHRPGSLPWVPMAAILLLPVLAIAQDTSGGTTGNSAADSGSMMAEIIVTAQRREQQLQDVPLAVSAYSSDQLDRLQVTDALDAAHLIPNLIGHNNTGLGTANAYTLRGLGNSESIATFDPPVGSYIDDVYVARQNANNFTLFDVDRIEVLRGPQGTLFGRNTTGGAVRVILKKPADEFGGYVEGGYGSYDRYNARGSIDVPLSSTVFTKFSGYAINDEGYVDDLTTGEKVNEENNYGLRGAIRWLASDDLTVDFAMDYEDDESANIANAKSGSSRITHTALTSGGGQLLPYFTGEKRTYGLGNEVTSFNASLNVDWVTSAGTLSSITGWRQFTQKFAMDFLDSNFINRSNFGQPPSPYGGYTVANDGDHEQFSQEFKFVGNWGDRLNYVTGLYYMHEDNDTDFGTLFDLDRGLTAPPFAPNGTYIPAVLSDIDLGNSTTSWAAYLQGDYNITDHWMATLGVRYTDERKDVSFNDNQPCQQGAIPPCFTDVNGDGIADSDLSNVNLDNLHSINPSFANIPRNLSTDLWTPRVALQYTVDDQLNFYASATRGFKSGGWNARGTTPDQLQPFGPEKVWSYELGMRSEWLDGRLRANLTAFYLDVSAFQVPVAFRATTGQVVFITKNFADLENKGLEAEFIAMPVENLTVMLTVGTGDAEYKRLNPSIAQQQQDCLNGNTSQCGQGIVEADGSISEPVRVPDYTVNFGGSYVWNLNSTYDLVPSAYLYSVGSHNTVSTGGPMFEIDGYTTYDASLQLKNNDHNWSVVAECKNCNDRTMLVSGLAGVPYYQKPRLWHVGFRKSFGARQE